MKFNYEKLGNYISESKEKNKDGLENNLLGVSVNKELIPSIANTVGTNLKNYKLVKKNQFIYGPVTSRNSDKISIALLKEDSCIVSSSYKVFEIIDENVLIPDFLMLWFKREEFDRYARYMSHGSVREVFDFEDMCNVDIPLPPLKVQEKIVKIQQFLEDRISLKNSINKNLEEQIKNLFINWFQHFEPFKNEEFYDTKLGNIPVGWKIGTLSDLLKLTKNSIKPGENNDLPYVPIDIIPMNSLGLNKLNSNDEAKSSLITFDKNDILIGAMRVYFHRVAIAPCNGITRSTCFVLKPKKDFYLSYALALCNLNSTIDYAQNTSKGSTMPYAVWKKGLGDMEIVIPPDEILLKFSNLIFPMIELIRDSMYHRINLENLRDTLLPKLMSGEIDVSKINCDLD